MLTLAFDTATGVATSALVRDGRVVAERASRAVRVLADADELLEERGANVPPRDSELHLPRARFHVQLARDFVAPDAVEPIYLRIPDAEQPR